MGMPDDASGGAAPIGSGLGLLDAWDGDAVSGAGGESVELMYKPAEAVFGAVAEEMVRLGWSVFPQESDGRRPGRVYNAPINWQSEHHLADVLPTPKALRDWCLHCSGLNAAAVMGPGSGNAWTLDIDVTDPVLSKAVVDLADEMFGYTPLRRIGRAPKMALVYRAPPDEAVASTQRHFSEVDGDGNVVPSEHAVEILGKGKPLTFHGKHHKTGRYFLWPDKSPLRVGPDQAPVVPTLLIAEFLDRIDRDVRRFVRSASFAISPESWTWDDDRQATVPGRIQAAAGGAQWVEDARGKVVDGREKYLTTLVYQIARLNRGMPPERIAHITAEQFAQTAEMSGRWSANSVLRLALDKARRLVAKIGRGETRMTAPRSASPAPDGKGRQDERGKQDAPGRRERQDAPGPAAPDDDRRVVLPVTRDELRAKGLEFLPDSARRRAIKADITAERADVAMDEERRLAEVRRIATDLRAALDAFFADVEAFRTDPGAACRIHILKAPTGAGKTSQSIRYIGEHRTRIFAGDGTFKDEDGKDRQGVRPIVMLLPTYANINELRSRASVLNLNGALSDADLRAQAEEMGLIAEDELDGKLQELRRDAIAAGLETMVYRGKIAAGCQMKEKVELAMAAGVNSSAFCHVATKDDGGEPQEEHCEHYYQCEAISQRDRIQRSHVVFMPHAFMSLNVPDDLKYVRAVIVDERIHHAFLNTTTFPISSLMIFRKAPKLTKKEREGCQGAEDRRGLQDELLGGRKEAADIVIEAMQAGRCPAEALYVKKSAAGKGGEPVWRNLLTSALRVCGSAIQRDGTLSPTMPIEEVRELCSQPTGVDIREEFRFWKIVEERIKLLQEDSLAASAIANAEKELAGFQGDPDARLRLERRLAEMKAAPRRACGGREMRIQFLRDHVGGGVRESVRISWRTQPNWSDVPMLLLDASAAPDIISKIWGGKGVVVHDIQGPLNVRTVGVVNRTFSNASVLGSAGSPPDEQALVARRLSQIRLALSTVSAMYGWGRVVAGASIVVRRAVNNAWAGPENVDWCHFGAMRGLDFAKHHAAAFSIGRMEVPTRSIDGLVAALTYDDQDPEQPFDRSGTGLTADGKPLMLPAGVQRIRMRDGRVVELPAPMYPGKWGRMLQRQYREEELMQFVGRLRPVYREGDPPVWFALSSVIPEDLIVDDLIHIDDLLSGKTYLWDAVRRTGGVAEPEVLAACCPEYFRDAAAARRVMAEMGFDLASGEVSHRNTWGFVSLRWRAAGRPWSFAYARAEASDHAGLLAASLAAHLGVRDAEAEVVARSRGRTLARPRDVDKIDAGLGSMEERRAAEAGVMEDAAVEIFSLPKDLDRNSRLTPAAAIYPVAFAAGSHENLRHIWMTHADWEARITLDRLWNRLRHEDGKADQAKPLIRDSGDVYEAMADHVDDSDDALDREIAY